MPSSIQINGKTIRRPGVYAEVDASALAGSELVSNVLAVVGDFQELQSATPTYFNTANQIQGFSDNYDIKLLGKVIYAPANDSAVGGSPTGVYLVNGGASTQALTTFVDADATNALTFLSKVYGTPGNTGTVGCVVPSGGTGGDRTVTFNVNGVTETLEFDGRDLVTFKYQGTDATAVTWDVKDTSGTRLRVTQTRSAIASGALSLATASWKWDGALTFTASGSGNHSLAVSGIRKDTGATFSSTLTFTASTTPDAALGFDVSAITALTWTPAASETLTVTGYAFNLDLTSSEFRTIKQVFDHIGAYSSQGWSVVYNDPKAGSLLSLYMDKVDAATDIFNPAVDTVTADLYRLYQAALASSLVTPVLGAITTTGLKQIAAISGVQNMAGGTFTAGTPTSIASAYTALRSVAVKPQIIAHYYTDLTSQQGLRTHCNYMATEGYGECNGWVATPAGETKANIITRTGQLNSRFIATCAQEIQITDHTGATIWASPTVQALMCAAMQASTPIGTPLTWKVANVQDVRSNSSWDADEDANEMLDFGLCFFTTDPLGFKVERSITTYQTDDNDVFSQVSSVESANTSLRDLRQYLTQVIGTSNVVVPPAIIKSLAKSRLRSQVTQGWIAGFEEGSVRLVSAGSVNNLEVTIYPSNSNDFIKIKASLEQPAITA